MTHFAQSPDGLTLVTCGVVIAVGWMIVNYFTKDGQKGFD